MDAASNVRAESVVDRRELVLGSTGLEIHHNGTGPAGAAHYVGTDRRPICGDGPVRYTFPGRRLSSARVVCPECVAATRTTERLAV
jgi:hypothetical protein